MRITKLFAILLSNMKESTVPSKTDLEERFVRCWQESQSIAEISTKMGMPYWGVASRASRLRKLGVKLKLLTATPRPRRVIDVSRLNSIAREAVAK